MAQEQFQNLAASTSAGSINNSSDPVTFSVAAGEGTRFPATTNGPFRVTVSDADGTNAEVMLCTSLSTDALTCARAGSVTFETPTPTKLTHASGSIVSHNLTAGAFRAILTQYLYGDPLTAPTTSTFGTTLESASATSINFANNTAGSETGVIISAQSASGDTRIVSRLTAVPTPPYTIRCRFRANSLGGQYPMSGVCWSDGTKFHCCGTMNRDQNRKAIRFTGFADVDTFNGNSDSELPWEGFPGRFGLYDLMIEDDGVNRNVYLIGDGVSANKQLFKSITNTEYFTPTLVGIFVAPGHNNIYSASANPEQIKVIDWTVA